MVIVKKVLLAGKKTLDVPISEKILRKLLFVSEQKIYKNKPKTFRN